MKLYLAGLPTDCKGSKEVPVRAGVENVLCSFAGGPSKTTARDLASRGGYEKQMLLYLAGSLGPDRLMQMGERVNAYNYLETFAHDSSRELAAEIAVKKFNFRLFIDSGAFTAWVKGIKIDLKEYMAFCHELMESSLCPLTFAALDEIAGTRSGPTPSAADFELACQHGWDNYLEMKANGIKSLPTFHQGDDWKWLYTIADDADYFALAPRKVGKSTQEKFSWLNECFDRLGPRAWQGPTPALKIHGLGISSPPMMERFPWFSVDSTAWLQGARSGSYRYFNGHRAPIISQQDWRFETTHSIEPIYHYRNPHQGTEDGQFGTYWFNEQFMRADVLLQAYITDHWADRGIIWNEEPA